MSLLNSTFRAMSRQTRAGAAARPLIAALCLSTLLPACGDTEQPLPGGQFELVSDFSDSKGSTGAESSTGAATTGQDSSLDTLPESSTTGAAVESSTGATEDGATGATGANTDTTAEQAAPQQTQRRFAIQINLENNSVDLIEGKSIKQTIPFKRRNKKDWVQDCPKQVSADLLEVVDLQVPQVVFAGVTIPRPVLSSTCALVDDDVIMRSADADADLNNNEHPTLYFTPTRVERPIVPAQ